ncbi:MAG: hypothetical protein K9G76_05090 [Bacteroidales bacterium]|nr:hypothetical protein [Bacteroidales bacterium]MCF8403055.1 hypothetical protein [Bacteroidales bacterium]
MNLQRIEDLILKYENGETSLAEEEELRDFFSRDQIPVQFKAYGEIFGFFGVSKQETIANPDFDMAILEQIHDMEEPKKTRFYIRYLYPIAGIAASILLIIGLYFSSYFNNAPLGTYDDPEIAYAETRKILLKVSGNLNSGLDELSNVEELNKGVSELENMRAFNVGVTNFRKISILDKSKDIITQKSK